MNYLKIHDWDQWQSYRKDRGQPPWIKVHRKTLRKPKWVALTDEERGQLVSLWMLAADENGSIPNDPKLIQRLCYMSKPPNLSHFQELGWIDNDGCQTGAMAASKRQPHVAPEAKAEAEKNREEEIYGQSAFDRFWMTYPKKVKKKEAMAAWKKIKDKKTTLGLILKALEWQKELPDWKKENGQFIPYPASYLNGQRWEDEQNGEQGNGEVNDNLFLRSLREKTKRNRGGSVEPGAGKV